MSDAAEAAFVDVGLSRRPLTWSEGEGYLYDGRPATENELSEDAERTVFVRRVGEAAYRQSVRKAYEREGTPEGMNYFEGWRAFLNREEAAGKHPKWFWDGFIRE